MRFVTTEEDFWNYVNNFLVKYDKAYSIRETNSTLTAVYDKEKNLGISYRRSLTPEEMSNLWIFSSTKIQVKTWLKNNRLDVLPEMYSSTKKNLKVFYDMPIDTVFMATDLNHCYWRMAYKLGYIKTKLYERLIDENLPDEKKKAYKLLRNKALACLRSKEKNFQFKGMVRVRDWYEGSGEMEQLYNDIRNRCYKIMYEISKEIPEGFIKYKTDCIYYLPEYQKKVEEIMDLHSMPFTTFECIKIDEVYFEENFSDVKKM
jgi:hypothetical protein